MAAAADGRRGAAARRRSGAAGAAAARGASAGNTAALIGGPGEDQDRLSYAPTYFPGVASITEARSVAVGVSQEVLDIDFGLQLVRTSRVSGHVENPDGTRPSGGNVNLTPDGAAGGRGALGTNYGSRINWDGSFSIGNVPPGRYTLRARSNDSDTPLSASQPLSVGGGDLANVSVMLSTGGSLVRNRRVSIHADAGPERSDAGPRRGAVHGSVRPGSESRTRGSTRTETSRSRACRPGLT